MPPATADIDTPLKSGDKVAVPVAAGVIIYGGVLVALGAAGLAAPATKAAGLKILGRAEQQVDNRTGAAGAVNVLVRRNAVFFYANSAGDPVTQAQVGGPVYAEDDSTVCKTGVDGEGDPNASVAGRAISLEDAGVWVEIA